MLAEQNTESNRAGKFLLNGVTMTFAALLMRTVAMAFNSYVARTVGAEAIGLYSLLSGVYGFAVTLALSGINLSVTRLISEFLAVGDRGSASGVLKRSFVFALFFGGLSSFGLFFLSEAAASSWLHELRVIRPLKILCATLPAAAVSSVINGYFTAVRRVYKNAISQFTEMAVKIGVTVILFFTVTQRDAETACVLLALGGVIAEGVSLILNLLLYIIDKSYYIGSLPNASPQPSLGKRILEISMPVALASYVRSALVSLEHSLIPKGLLKYGSDSASALSAYGTLGSMALTVINFPYALIGSFSALMIPEVTESRAQGKKRHIRYLAHRTYQASSVFSFCLMGIFFEFSNELGNFLYSSELAGVYIRQLSFIVPIMYTDTVTDSLLKGMGEQLYSMKVNIADALISVTLVWLLVPRYGIMGYIVTIYIAEIINAALSIAKATKVCGIGKEAIFMYIKSLFSAIGALAVSRLFINLFNIPIQFFIYLIAYFVLVKATSLFSDDDRRWIKSFFLRQKS